MTRWTTRQPYAQPIRRYLLAGPAVSREIASALGLDLKSTRQVLCHLTAKGHTVAYAKEDGRRWKGGTGLRGVTWYALTRVGRALTMAREGGRERA